MHIPDGFLDLKTVAVTASLAGVGIGFGLSQARQQIPAERTPLMGLAAAFIFAAQMLNFPVLGGTSGHLVGGVLAAVLLGPSAAVVIMTAVLIIQCFLFNDGGILSLGANIFNMGLVAPLGGYAIYRSLRTWFSDQRGAIFAAIFAGWCSTVLAALSCAGQLAFAGTASWSAVLPAMIHVHLLVGVGEGLITGLVLVAIARVRPELTDFQKSSPRSLRYPEFLGYGLLLALGLALFVAPFASPWPDGLEKVAHKLGFADKAISTSMLPTPLSEYQLPGVSSAVWATAWAGAIGTVAAFLLAWLCACWLVPKRQT